jgi:hypothetical protein
MKKSIALLITTVGSLFFMGLAAISMAETPPLAQVSMQPTSTGILSIGLLGLALIFSRLFLQKK